MNTRCWCLTVAVGFVIGLLSPVFSLGQDKSKPKDDKLAAAARSVMREKGKLSPRIRKLLREQVVPALESERSDLVYQLLAHEIVKFSENQLKDLEDFSQENKLPSIQQQFVEAHVSAVEQGLVTAQKLPLPITLYISGEVNRRLGQELLEMQRHKAFDGEPQLPQAWHERELLFWDIHVLRNRLLNLERIAQYISVIQAPHLKIASKKPDDNAELIESINKFNEAHENVKNCLKQLELNEAIFHLQQLPDALLTLESNQDFEPRLYAAFALQDSYSSLVRYFKDARPEMERCPELVEAKGDQRIESWYQAGKKVGGDVLEKSILLRVGAHWWLRGRYGIATECYGLLKPQEAMTRPEAMFGLFMPKSPNKPISRYLGEDDGQYGYDRRHFYSWAVEYRYRVGQNDSRTLDSKTVVKITDTKIHKASFW